MSATMTHYRLASAAAGDDASLTRYIRVDRGAGTPDKPRKLQPRIPGLALPFVEEGRTKFRKSVKRVDEMKTLLVSGHSNVKIGRDVRKGKFKGYWIYTLSLEERKTCPSSCAHWQTCYGNNMPFAKRIDHTTKDFLFRLEDEIEALCRKKAGVLIRLHALGDFYSVDYVGFWRDMLRKHANLALYGYTAHGPAKRFDKPSPIGKAIWQLWAEFKERAMIRWSNGPFKTMSTAPIPEVSARPADAFVCPEQTGQTRCCATCGACWSTTKNVAFLDH